MNKLDRLKRDSKDFIEFEEPARNYLDPGQAVAFIDRGVNDLALRILRTLCGSPMPIVKTKSKPAKKRNWPKIRKKNKKEGSKGWMVVDVDEVNWVKPLRKMRKKKKTANVVLRKRPLEIEP
ncbi:hypothetical protein HDU67_001887 [Dinochytrium kinnereticum]|nr:hypothetical protein HDU67_001887 [Dinochytrium kinnereticum]